MNLVDELFKVTKALADAGIDYAVCGGMAVTMHGYPRFTRDLDLLVGPADVSRVLDVVRPLGYDVPANPMTFGHGTTTERHIQRVSKLEPGGDMLTLDILLADAAYDGLMADRVELSLEGGQMFVVSRAALLKMKRLASRPQDLVDIEKLEGVEE